MGSIRLGSGILIARLEDGTWSAPSAMALAGIGGGGQVGFELADFVFILHDERAVRAFSQTGALSVGGNVSLAFGPIGRSAEGAGVAGVKGVGGIYAWSTTRGFFGGISLEGSILLERSKANKKMYGREVTAEQLLKGDLSPPPAAEPLLHILNSDVFSSPESSPEQPEHLPELANEPRSLPPPGLPAEPVPRDPSEDPQEISHEPPSLPPLNLSSETTSQNPSELPSEAAPEHPTGQPQESSPPAASDQAPETRARPSG